MESYNLIKNEILQINAEMTSLFATAGALPGLDGNSFQSWETTCNTISKQISEDLIRIAVVGAIKSGKSTFANALFRGDYLKRGAGVVTSMVTRVRWGSHLAAHLFFKSWDEVNADMNQAMILFPSLNWSAPDHRFDIRRQADRDELKRAVDALETEQLISQDTRNVNSVLLTSYLAGYERVKEIVSTDSTILIFDADHFGEHRQYVGDDALSVYLRDIELSIATDNLDLNLEIADCQGSDSPNPLHLAMIQDYLVLTHLIIYVISSRTGVRQADIRFLSMIKKMGIMDSMLFVINCDFGEHDSLAGLKALIGKISEELALIVAAPRIFAFSSLHALFAAQKEPLSARDQSRLAQWEAEPDFIAFSQAEASRFESAFRRKVNDERAALLLRNHLERLDIISSGLLGWIRLNRDILRRDATGMRQVAEKIKHHQRRMDQMKSMIKSTLDGAVGKIKKELKHDVDRFFDPHSGTVMASISEFVRSYQVPFANYLSPLKTSGFAAALYLVYQEFKQAVDGFMAESVNPEIIQFVRKLEKSLAEQLETIAEPYAAMVNDALNDYRSALGELDISFSGQKEIQKLESQDLEALKHLLGLRLPPARAALRYSAHVKTEALARLGLYTLARLLKKAFKKPLGHEQEGELQALKDGVRRMKHETQKSIEFTFKDYRENIKYQYMLKLADCSADHLYARLLDQFQAYVGDLSSFIKIMGEKETDKAELSNMLARLESSTVHIDQSIAAIKADLVMLTGEEVTNQANSTFGG
jgi:GTPase SAR1 family protein